MRKLLMSVIFAFIFVPLATQAKPAIYKKFIAVYPDTPRLQTISCMICHSNMNDYARNPYGRDLEAAMAANGGVINFQAIENLDSDGDGYTNIQEIKSDTAPR